jgi:hypothetical protein
MRFLEERSSTFIAGATHVEHPSPDENQQQSSYGIAPKGTVALSHREVILESATGRSTSFINLFPLFKRQ